MITVRITFLLPYLLDPKLGKVGKAKSNKNERRKIKHGPKTKKSQSDASSKSDRKFEKKDAADVLNYEYSVGNPIGFAHIEYQLFPGNYFLAFRKLC